MAIIAKNNVVDAMGFTTVSQLDEYLSYNSVTMDDFLSYNNYTSYTSYDGYMILVDSTYTYTYTGCAMEDDGGSDNEISPAEDQQA